MVKRAHETVVAISEADAYELSEVYQKLADIHRRISSYTPSVVEKKRRKRDPNLPKKPMTAYLLFSNDYRQSVRESNPNIVSQDVSKKLGEKWKALSGAEREKYEKMHQALKAKYDISVAKYRQAKADGMLPEDAAAAAAANDDDDEDMESVSTNESDTESEEEEPTPSPPPQPKTKPLKKKKAAGPTPIPIPTPAPASTPKKRGPKPGAKATAKAAAAAPTGDAPHAEKKKKARKPKPSDGTNHHTSHSETPKKKAKKAKKAAS